MHLSPSDIKVSYVVSNILLTAMLSTTLIPNGKFSGNFFWRDMGLTNLEKGSNTLSGCWISVVRLFMILFISTQFCTVLIMRLKKWNFD